MLLSTAAMPFCVFLIAGIGGREPLAHTLLFWALVLYLGGGLLFALRTVIFVLDGILEEAELYINLLGGTPRRSPHRT